jgi:hypothetical protein
MGFFRKDVEQPTPIADDSGTSSPTEKLGDEKNEVVMPTREVDAPEEKRYDGTLTLISSTGLDVSDEVGFHSERTAVSSFSHKQCSVLWTECRSAMPVYTEWKTNSE